MAFSHSPQLEADVLKQIGAWTMGDGYNFRTILNNAIDICADAQALISRLAMRLNRKPVDVQMWRKGKHRPNAIDQKLVIDFIKALIEAEQVAA